MCHLSGVAVPCSFYPFSDTIMTEKGKRINIAFKYIRLKPCSDFSRELGPGTMENYFTNFVDVETSSSYSNL